MAYGDVQRPHDPHRVLTRIEELRRSGAEEQAMRRRIRAIMDGGPQGIMAIMAWDQGRQANPETVARRYGFDLQTVNLMASGSERLGQEVGAVPKLRAATAQERELRQKAAKRRSIVADWDRYQQIAKLFPQIGRWLPGYSHAMWVISQGYYGYSEKQTPFPKVELRDSFDLFFGHGVDPDDAAVVRKVPLRRLRQLYPELSWDAISAELERKVKTRPIFDPTGPSRWEGENTGCEVVEYFDCNGRSLYVPELPLVLGFAENPIWPEPAFVPMRKYSFSNNVSAYHHVIGLVGMMAKLNMLGLIASEEGVFRETNIFGDLLSGTYKKGRRAVNTLSTSSRVEKPTGDQAQTIWAQMDRLERQLRIGAAYDVSSDGISPNSYVTGQGIEQLRTGAGRNVAEYQQTIRLAAERLDARRLMWAERVWPADKVDIYDFGRSSQRTYVAKVDIAGDYRTRRQTPVPNLWGSPQEVSVGLQALAGGLLDTETMQDSIPGIEDGEAILANNRARKAEEALMARFVSTPPGQPFTPGPVEEALVRIMNNPDDQAEILEELMVPDEPAPQDPMAELAAMGAAPGGPGGPPNVWDALQSRQTQTALSRVMSNGQADLGTQTVITQ